MRASYESSRLPRATRDDGSTGFVQVTPAVVPHVSYAAETFSPTEDIVESVGRQNAFTDRRGGQQERGLGILRGYFCVVCCAIVLGRTRQTTFDQFASRRGTASFEVRRRHAWPAKSTSRRIRHQMKAG